MIEIEEGNAAHTHPFVIDFIKFYSESLVSPHSSE